MIWLTMHPRLRKKPEKLKKHLEKDVSNISCGMFCSIAYRGMTTRQTSVDARGSSRAALD